MEIRFSASSIKKYLACPFHFYCKITKQEKSECDSSYGDAGTAVHKTLETYYSKLKGLAREEALERAKLVFEAEWLIAGEPDRFNRYIKKDLYWLSVLNGINKNVNATDIEMLFEIKEDDFWYYGLADVVDRENHIIGDWKTSTYKKSKVAGYEKQVSYYAYGYWKSFGVVPKAWVLFNKTDKLFEFTYTLEKMHEIEKELKFLTADFNARMQTKDFPRTPSTSTCHFCEYKEVCAGDLLRESKSDVYEVTFELSGNKAKVKAVIPKEIQKKIQSSINYLVKNAHFRIQAMKAKGRIWDGIKVLYKTRDYGGEAFIGDINTIYVILKDYATSQGKTIKGKLKDFRNQGPSTKSIDYDPLHFEYDLYDYQKEAVTALIKARWGIVEVATGGGKTVIAAEAIRQLGVKTLFLIDNKDLLIQTKQEYEAMLGIECGIVGMGHRDWDKQVVLSTIQTVAKSFTRYAGELAKFGLVIYDEVQIIGAKSFEQISKYLINTKYRFGFSATARRDDGNTNIIHSHTGNVVYKKAAPELIEQGILINPKATFYSYNASALAGGDYNNEYEERIVDNAVRNEMILSLAKENLAKNRQVMIVTRRIKHAEYFRDNLEGAAMIFGKTKDKVREQIMKDFKAGKIRVLAGNIAIFNKGLNVKSLEVIINAAGNGGGVLTVQTLGRSIRTNLGKTTADYIDFIDPGKYLLKHSNTRMQALEDEGYKIVKKHFS